MRAFFVICTTLVMGVLGAKVPLLNDFEKAIALSKVYEKPIVLLFTGSDWSPESQALLGVIENESFEKHIGSHFLFVDADFPEVNVQRTEVIAENNSLKERFGVTEFPTLIFLDLKGDELKRIGYTGEEAKEFAEKMRSVGVAALNLREKLKQIDFETVAESELERIYSELVGSSMASDADYLLNCCMEKGMGVSILMDRYSQMLSRGLQGAKECLKMKEQLHRDCFAGRSDLKMRLALIDFQSMVGEDPSGAEQVLRDSIADLERRKSETVWQLHMLLAEHLFGQNRVADALLSARNSMRAAPGNGRSEVKELIERITARTDRENSTSQLEAPL